MRDHITDCTYQNWQIVDPKPIGIAFTCISCQIKGLFFLFIDHGLVHDEGNSFVIVIQLDWTSSLSRQKFNFPANQKGYDNFETTIGKLLARRIQICLVQFYKSHFWPLFFKITFQIMSERHSTKQNRIRVVKYSSFEVSDPCEVPLIAGKLFF